MLQLLGKCAISDGPQATKSVHLEKKLHTFLLELSNVLQVYKYTLACY